jgi:hypothetical protein
MITRQIVADQIAAWLHHEITLATLVDWAEEAVREGDFAESEAAELAHLVGRLGLADVREFGLSWQDCEELLKSLGFTARVEITAG